MKPIYLQVEYIFLTKSKVHTLSTSNSVKVNFTNYCQEKYKMRITKLESMIMFKKFLSVLQLSPFVLILLCKHFLLIFYKYFLQQFTTIFHFSYYKYTRGKLKNSKTDTISKIWSNDQTLEFFVKNF